MNPILKAMKKIVSLVTGAALMILCMAAIPGTSGDNRKNADARDVVTVSATPELYHLATAWADGFMQNNPGIKIRVVGFNGAPDAVQPDLSLLTADQASALASPPAWKTVVGRDAVVPFVSDANPYLESIRNKGIAPGEFANLFEINETRTWSGLLGEGPVKPVNFYLTGDDAVRGAISRFTGMDPVFIDGISANDPGSLLEAVAGDPFGMGFGKLADLTGPNGELKKGIALLPIDRNANGRIDYVENIYGSVADLSRGIWIGKLPAALCGNVYVTASLKPSDRSETAFLKFILTGGQDALALNGFNKLETSERLSRIDHLPGNLVTLPGSDGVNPVQLLITILAVLAVITAIIILVIRYRRSNIPVLKAQPAGRIRGIGEAGLTVPRGLLYDRSHTWTFMETDGTVKIGIDDFLQHVTGRITSIKMKLPGEKVRKGDPVMTLVQNGKRLTISSPVSGIILADNSILFTDPSMINSAPYSDGWIYRIQPTNWMRETQFFLMAEKYSEWIHGEFSRLRDFLANIIKPDNPQYACVILQDGGEIADHLLETLPPEAWEEFQVQFMDTTK